MSEPIHPEIYAQLQDLWASVQASGRPELILLEGAAGLGKSHLARALAGHAGREPQSAVALAAPGALISALLLSLPELLTSRDAVFIAAARPHLNHAWPVVLPPPIGPSDPTTTLAHAIAGAVARARPLLLIVEDLHDQPPEARAFLNTLWTRLLLDERPALLLVTTRPLTDYPDAARSAEELGRSAQLARAAGQPDVPKLVLRPLGANQVESLLRSALGPQVPPGLPEWLLEHAEGHPLRSAELLRVLRERGALAQRQHHWHFTPPPPGSLPDSLGAVLRERLRPVQAARAPWAALSALAVLDAPTPEQAWRRVAGLGTEAFHQARDWLLHRDLVRLHSASEGQYACAHPLYPPLVRAELEWEALEALHTRAAQTDLDVLVRARHARLAGLPEARTLTEQALALARERAAPHDVIREARALLDDHLADETAREALVAALDVLGQWDEVLNETAGDLAELPLSLLAYRAQALSYRAQLPEALAAARIGLARANAATSMTGLQSAVSVAYLTLEDVVYRTLLNQGQLDEAEEGLTATLTHAQEPVRRMQLLEILARLHQRRGDYHLALHLARDAVALLSKKPPSSGPEAERHWRTLSLAGAKAIHMSLWAEAETYLRAAHDLIVRQGYVASLMVVEGNLAYLQLMQGQYPDAEAGTWRQYHRAVANGNVRVQGALLWNLGICRLWRGDPEQALSLMRQSYEVWPSVAAANSSDFAEALALMGCLEEARAELALPDHDFYPEHPNSRARVHLLLGEPEHALRETARIRPEDGTGLQARAALIRAQAQLLLGNLAQADTELHVAQGHAQAAQHRSVLAEVNLTRAALCVTRGEDGTADWYAGVSGLRAVDGQGHVQLVRACFPTQVSALEAAATPSAAPASRARLRLLGMVQLEQADGVRPWRARKVKELLGLLICAHYSEAHLPLTRETLALTLWPDADEISAEVNFRKALTRLREALGGSATLTRTPHGYVLSDLNTDLNDFLAALEARQDAQAAAAYSGPFMNDLDLPDITELREALHARWRDVILRLTYRDAQSGLPHLKRLLAQDPLDVEVTRALLNAHEQLGERQIHADTLRRVQTLFRTTLGEVPPELTAAAG